MIGILITQFTTDILRKKAAINKTGKRNKKLEEFLIDFRLERLQQKTIVQESF